ncbi:helix-turn-helix transcriptional regulator [Thalassospira indica]|uniref:XRE family transcriptional regulator n=1 Tax=Thalassospira indica TaxID=1891279 RepID=A0ABM6XVV6_9PROT|nr:helix-turn-helix transcriptional regulator [Thalassospira indica]AXO13755.1 XRE family transcriptional regulator [Thalassospira indica]
MPNKYTFLRNEEGLPIAVTMTFEEFRNLAPEIAEEYLTDEQLADVAARDDDGSRYPYEVMQRVLAGDHPVKVFREFRGMTQGELAEKVDVAGNYISMIERGKNPPSRKLQAALAKALDVDYGMLETGPSFEPA